MKRQWIKLYLEILDDSKMGRMPDLLWRRTIELFLIAGESDKDGLLPPVEDLAWRLRTTVEEMAGSLNALAGVVEQTPQGWFVTKFKDRQYSESYERVKRYRNANSNASGNADVAEKQSSSPSSSYSYSDSSEGGGTGEGEVFAAYEKNIGLLTPHIADGIKSDVDDFTAAWVLAAIEYATKQEKRSLSYVEGVLKGWKRDGLQSPPKNGNGSKPTKPKQDNIAIIRKVAQNAH